MGWQDVVAIAVVVGALGYLASLVLRGVVGGRKGGGAACGKCSATHAKPVEVEVATIGSAKVSRSD
jgi:hypothetical protein